MKRNDIIQYTGNEVSHADYHDGQLRPVVGVQNVQVMRANRTHPEWADGFGWTYNHAPMLAYWKGKFYLEYLSNPVSEHVPPGQTLLATSPDGIRWEKPAVVFPTYLVSDSAHRNDSYPVPEDLYSVMHQRMGFYLAPNGVFLVLGFYGVCLPPKSSPNNGRGIGRVVREIKEDGSFGPIHFIRYNRHAGWNEANTRYPFYAASEDSAFKEACESLLQDKLATLQWWEEDRSPDGFYAVEGEKAACTYRLKDGRVVALWKHSRAAVSSDDGRTWSEVQDNPSLITAGGKAWGQQTSDGRYAIVYNPTPSGKNRWPLAVVVGEDGVRFDRLLCVNGEVPPLRFNGLAKDYGLSYTRSIEAADGTPPGGDMWVAYSANKEDLWISRIPVPIRHRVDTPVDDVFDDMDSGGPVRDWNIHSAVWAEVSVVPYPSERDKSLRLQDRDPYDYAKAERVFPESRKAEIRFRLLAEQSGGGQLFVEICDHRGYAPVRMWFDSDGAVKLWYKGSEHTVCAYEAGVWYDVAIHVDAIEQSYRVSVGESSKSFRFIGPVLTVERIVFRTGPRRSGPTDESPAYVADLPGADEPVEEAVYYINRLRTADHEL